MTELEKALVFCDNKKMLTRITASVSTLVVLAFAVFTWVRFEEVYAMKLSVYPTASAIGTLSNIMVLFCLAVLNGIVIYQLQLARQRVALKAFLLLTDDSNKHWLNHYKPLVGAFLDAAGLPDNYSIQRLTKMNMLHFMTHAAKIDRAIHAHRPEWVALATQSSHKAS